MQHDTIMKSQKICGLWIESCLSSASYMDSLTTVCDHDFLHLITPLIIVFLADSASHGTLARHRITLSSISPTLFPFHFSSFISVSFPLLYSLVDTWIFGSRLPYLLRHVLCAHNKKEELMTLPYIPSDVSFNVMLTESCK